MNTFRLGLIFSFLLFQNGLSMDLYESILTKQTDNTLNLLKNSPGLAYSLYDQNLTTLHLAAQVGDLEVVKALAELDYKFLKMRDSTLETAFDFALFFESTEVALYLLSLDPNLAYPFEKQKHPSVNYAARRNDVEVLKKIAEIDENILKMEDVKGWSPIHHASAHDKVEAANFILDLLPFEAYMFTKKNETPMHLAAKRNALKIAQRLLEITKDNPDYLTSTDVKLETALHKAAKNGSIPMIKLILKANPNIRDFKNAEGLTAAQEAKKRKHFKAAAVIEEKSYLVAFCMEKLLKSYNQQ